MRVHYRVPLGCLLLFHKEVEFEVFKVGEPETYSSRLLEVWQNHYRVMEGYANFVNYSDVSLPLTMIKSSFKVTVGFEDRLTVVLGFDEANLNKFDEHAKKWNYERHDLG